MPLIKDDHVVETLTSNGADHPFDKWILPRGARCGKDLLYPETVDASIEVRSVGLVSIPSCAKTRPFRNRPQISSLDALGIRAESRVFRDAGRRCCTARSKSLTSLCRS